MEDIVIIITYDADHWMQFLAFGRDGYVEYIRWGRDGS
jgi:hypothetical protein